MIVKKISVDFDSGVDLIVSISRNVDLNDGLWFNIENSTDLKSKDFKIPQNMYRALLEVYASFYENNESWYGNSVNEYVSLNNLSVPRNGVFREVIVSLDEMKNKKKKKKNTKKKTTKTKKKKKRKKRKKRKSKKRKRKKKKKKRKKKRKRKRKRKKNKRKKKKRKK
ncbi:Peptide-N4-(N-acetyl-beta-glucosaminyl)asparagine amidase A [Capsicum baccatum]|uniref:Peptide-N4-(N-acetyl-beta-glucosaminyl)asparagine amidase A n=1 Tax=Capsicum baccatum TaxID=33114 RepID=A0A2G2WB61_CAPBA|nr:Peptide-N4-(N-acetyl-beta-glucosaminyl)asparagine amidase A [Capsicum baccatum]